METPRARLHELRRGVAMAAARLVYSSSVSGATPWAQGDAVDTLVHRMRSLSAQPTEAEAAEYEHQLERRRELVEAQRRHEQRRREARVLSLRPRGRGA
jgi:predicted ATP-grasp superfamily ATP-dependent carboligase